MKNLKEKLTKDIIKKANKDKEVLKSFLIEEVLFDTAKKYEFTKEQKMEIDFQINNEIVKFYVRSKLPKEVEVDEKEITDIYLQNEGQFTAQKIEFSVAREQIKNELLKAKAFELENLEYNKLVDKMDKQVSISKEEFISAKGNGEKIKRILLHKIIVKKIKEEKFDKSKSKEIENIEKAVYITNYMDSEIIKKVKVTREEIDAVYEQEKVKFANVTLNDAYNQIATTLLNNKVEIEKNKIIEDVVKSNNIEKIIKETKI